MTVQTTTSRADYTGNGVTTAFTVPFYFLDSTHLIVYRTQISTSVVTTLALTTDYTVTGAGVGAGGTVTCLVAPTADQRISILRNVPLTQLTDYVANDPFPAESHEQALDKLTMEVQQVNEVTSRALTLSPTSTGVSTQLPAPVSNRIIGWNPAGTGLQNYDSTTLAANVTYGQTNAMTASGNGVTTQFTLNANGVVTNNVQVFISGVRQTPGTDYTLNAVNQTVITFTSAPPSGTNNILFVWQQVLAAGTLSNNPTLTGNVTLANSTVNQVQYINASNVLSGSSNMTFNGTTLTVADITDSSLTSGRVVYAGAGGNLVNSANLTFDGTTLTANALTITNNPTLNGGTANGVLYLNGSKAATSGSALTFDGTNFATTGTASATKLIPTGGAATGNGMYLPAANTLAWSNNGSETMRLDSSGNLGLGVTPSAWSGGNGVIEFVRGGHISNEGGSTLYIGTNFYYNGTNYIYKTAQGASLYGVGQGTHTWYNAPSGTANTTTITNGVSYTIITSGNQTSFGAANNNVGTAFVATSSGTLSSGTVSQNVSLTQAMTLDASGNLGVGGTSPFARIAAYVASSGTFQNAIGATNSVNSDLTVRIKTSITDFYNSAGDFTFSTGGSGGTERARITSGGYFKASNAASYRDVTGTYHEFRNDAAAATALAVGATSTSFTNSALLVTANRNTTNNTFYAIDYYNDAASSYKFRVADSGNVTNTNNSYGVISDQKMKTDIVDAGSQWADIKAVRFRKFKMKDDPDQVVQLGVVAQEIEQTSPGLVEEHTDRDAEGNDLGTTTKSVKTSVLLMKAAVALQEAMTRIEQLEAKVAALESKGA